MHINIHCRIVDDESMTSQIHDISYRMYIIHHSKLLKFIITNRIEH
jgi:hypothetical protein